MPSDGNGRKTVLQFYQPPKRVISLVPSMTESMFELGFGETLVGITDYCTQPAGQLAHLPRLGGPKDPHIQDIIALQPELVLANWEENTRPAVEAIEDSGIFVWVTFPKSVRQALDVLWTLVGLYSSREAAIRLEVLEMTFEWAKSAAADRQPVRYFCPIWLDTTAAGQTWWMTFNQETYTHDLLASLGGENIFARRQRRYPLEADLGLAEAQDPGERDTRYPRGILDEIQAADPQVIILPDEPFEFSEQHIQEMCKLLPDCTAVKNERLHLVDGSLLTWHGTRLALALRELPGILAQE
jgi:iron complex transport system substrate-binding protein